MSKGTNKTRKIALILIIVLVIGPALTFAVLRSSRVQTFLVQRVAGYLSKELNTRVEVGAVDISFFLNIVLRDVTVEDREGNRMIKAGRMVFDISKISFRHRHISINKLFLEEAYLGLRKYKDKADYNFDFFIDYFSDQEKDEEAKADRWNLVCKSLEFNNSEFSFIDDNHSAVKHGFDTNNFVFQDVSLVVKDIFIEDNELSFDLGVLTFREFNTQAANFLSGHFLLSPGFASGREVNIRTAGTNLSLDVSLNYPEKSEFSNFFEDMEISMQINQSILDLSDLGFYIPMIYGLKDQVQIKGTLEGKPSNFSGKDFSLSYGSQTRFLGNFQVSGLPDRARTYLNFFVDELQTSIGDIAGFRLPYSANAAYIGMPENMYNLKQLSYRGRISGYLDNLSATGSFATGLGNFDANLSLKQNGGNQPYRYSGNISTKGFDLGSLLKDTKHIGFASFNANIEGAGLSLETLDLIIAGNISSMLLEGYDYRNITVSGEVKNRMFNGALQVDDANLSLDFLGKIDFGGELPVFDFNATVDKANLSALNLYQRNDLAESILSLSVNMNARGASLDDADGHIDFRDIVYEERFIDVDGEEVSELYNTNNISLTNINLPNQRKLLSMSSDFMDVALSGQIRYSWLGASIRQYASDFLPALFEVNQTANGDSYNPNLPEDRQDLTLEVTFKNTSLLSELFFPFAELSENSFFRLDFDSQERVFDIEGQSDTLSLNGFKMVEWNMLGSLVAGGYQFTNQSSRLIITDSLMLDNVCFDGLFYNDTLFYEANWKSFDPEQNSHGHVQGITRFFSQKHAELHFLPSYAMVDGERWHINQGNEVLIDSARIEINDLVFFNDTQMLKAEGIFSSDPRDRMHLYFSDFNYSNIDFLVRINNMDFGGIINGSLSFAAFFQLPVFEADLHIDDFSFNLVPLGELSLFSQLERDSGGFSIEGELADNTGAETVWPLKVSGHVFPERKDETFDLKFTADKLPLSVWARYLEVFAQDFHGLASGEISLKGPGSKPWIEGVAFAEQAGFSIEYLNTRYTISDKVEIGKEFFRFDNLILSDTLQNSGSVSGIVRHDGFSNFSLNVFVRPENMLILNTRSSQNDLYYGKAFGTGLLHIHGTEDNIIMDISARTNRGTQVFLPLTYTGEVIESNFITFVSKDTTLALAGFPDAVLSTGVTLNFDLDVTPDAEIQLIFDSQIGDIIRGRGTGSLKLEVTSQGAFNMYGEYNIQEGDYLFTLQNLMNKRFRIEQGGVIRWTGDPNDADVDIRAAYRLRTSLYDLMMDLDTSDLYRRRVPVECILIMQEKLFNPRISFDIFLPGSDEGTRELVERRITTEQEMNRQVFSLLVLNRFMPATVDQYNTALGYGVGSTSSELLSNQLSNWLSQISTEFDIGVNYRPGDEISSQELEVALSTQLFDDRVIIDGNVGVAGTNPAMSQRTSNIIGDVNVEIKITPEGKFRVKAFNRSNTFDLINANSPYTQGVGVFYRKEFDTIEELFRRSMRPSEVTFIDEE